METNEFDYRPFDRDIWEKELENFVPTVIYDMHTHMWSEAHRGALTGPAVGLRAEFNFNDHMQWGQQLYPDRELHLLVLGTPILGGMDYEGHNTWMADQVADDEQSVVNMIVTPDMSPEYVADQVDKHGFLGLKPYRVFAPDMTNCAIREFLPESLIEVAHDKHLAITLHLSKKTGVADPENQKDLKELTARYPGAKWILAHCARAFNAFMMEEAIHFLCDLPNIWYDTSAVNDVYSHFLLMKHEDRSRVMFGTDNLVVGLTRGKYISYGRAWEYHPGMPDLPHCDPTPTLVVYEQLRQEKQVADMLGLTEQEIEDHFSGNARRFIASVRSERKHRSG